jgi:hypothetical protein
LVLFDNLLKVASGEMGLFLEGKGYVEVWREWNSHWTDDARRTGDVIVLAHKSFKSGRSGG